MITNAAPKRLNEFFFGPDHTRWDLVRIFSAFCILGELVLMGLSGNYERFYGQWGMLERHVALDSIYWPGFLFLMKGNPEWIWEIYWALVAASTCLLIGLWTRVATVVTFFLYLAMIQRNLTSFNGEVGILALTLVALIFAPAPHRLSVDHLLLKKPLPTHTESWAARWLQINLCMMYFFTTAGKLEGDWRIGGSEIWYLITLSDWFRFTEVDWLRWPWVCWLATNGSLLVEGTFAFLVWTRLRLPLVLMVMALHLGIIILLCNALFFFNLAAIAGLCGFLRAGDFERLTSLFRKRRQTQPQPNPSPL